MSQDPFASFMDALDARKKRRGKAADLADYLGAVDDLKGGEGA